MLIKMPLESVMRVGQGFANTVHNALVASFIVYLALMPGITVHLVAHFPLEGKLKENLLQISLE
jgi:hypothetical protein